MSARDELGNPITQQRWEAVLVQLESACTSARKFARILMEDGPQAHEAEPESGLPAGTICYTCGAWGGDDGKIAHDAECCIPEVEAFLANPESAQRNPTDGSLT